MRIAFLHPDLGLGGAERLVVDCAVALHSKGHQVTMYTSHYESGRSFEETRDGRFAVEVHGDWLPRQILGGLHILFAMLRSLWLALAVALAGPAFDVYICDQVSVCVPVLRLLCPRSRVLFYCHFPDKLLAPRKSLLARLYRLPFDWVEEVTTAVADHVLVNSRFTQSVVAREFRTLVRYQDPEVLYPCMNINDADDALPAPSATASGWFVFLSINRFERKKNIAVAVEAFAALPSKLGSERAKRCRLVVAGGYDPRVAENTEHHQELRALAERNGLRVADVTEVTEEALASAEVLFVRSFSDAQKRDLLRQALAVLYTPSNEHFGIVPLEVMAAKRPVVVAASGGPLETVVDGETGLIVPEPTTTEGFATAMAELVSDGAKAARFGVQGRARVRQLFSRTAFADRLDAIVTALVRPRSRAWMPWVLLTATVGVGVNAIGLPLLVAWRTMMG